MPKKPIIQTPNGETEVLLHTCCAPCSSAIIEALLNNGIRPIIYYCNPNIYPQEEYEIRKNECTRYAESLGLEIVDDDYLHDRWLEEVRGLEGEPERGGRCLKCFKMRLLRTAEYAQKRGIRLITTTLASSRWKSLEQINEAGRWACEELGRRFRVKPGMTYEEPGMTYEELGMTCSEESGMTCEGTGDGNGEASGMTCEESGMVRDEESCALEGVSVGEKGISRQGLSDFRLTEAPCGQGIVCWWEQNWRKGGLQERRLQIIKEYNFYNQQYCGCEFSIRADAE